MERQWFGLTDDRKDDEASLAGGGTSGKRFGRVARLLTDKAGNGGRHGASGLERANVPKGASVSGAFGNGGAVKADTIEALSFYARSRGGFSGPYALEKLFRLDWYGFEPSGAFGVDLLAGWVSGGRVHGE